MKNDGFRKNGERGHPRLHSLEWLLYLPGAFIIAYGLWLSITVTG